jgi:hypothetical protein
MINKSKSNTRRVSNTVNVNDVVLDGILTVIGKNHNAWSGTMTNLQVSLVKVLNKKNSAVLPGSPGALRTVVNRIVNRLRTRGVSVKFARTSDHTRTRFVRFSR